MDNGILPVVLDTAQVEALKRYRTGGQQKMVVEHVTVNEGDGSVLDWNWLTSLPVVNETDFIAQARMDTPLTIKVDGRKTYCVMLAEQ